VREEKKRWSKKAQLNKKGLSISKKSGQGGSGNEKYTRGIQKKAEEEKRTYWKNSHFRTPPTKK